MFCVLFVMFLNKEKEESKDREFWGWFELKGMLLVH